MNILAKFHEERTVFDEIRGRLLILPFYRALTRASEGLLRKKALKFEVEVPHTPNFHRICLMILKIKKCGAPAGRGLSNHEIFTFECS